MSRGRSRASALRPRVRARPRGRAVLRRRCSLTRSSWPARRAGCRPGGTRRRRASSRPRRAPRSRGRVLQHRRSRRCRQRCRRRRHVALHVLDLVGGLERDAARVERDRLADDAEVTSACALRRVVAQHDQARLVRGCRGRPRRARPAELVELALASSVGLHVSSSPACSSAWSPSVCGSALRRRVREVARAVRALRDERGALGAGAQLRRLGVRDHDPLDLAQAACRRVLRLPRPASSRRGSCPSTSARAWSGAGSGRSRRAASRSCRRRGRAPARRRRRRCGRVEVDLGARRRALPRTTALVSDGRRRPRRGRPGTRRSRRAPRRRSSLACVERLRDRQRERVDRDLARLGEFDGHAHGAAMLSRLARSPDPQGAIDGRKRAGVLPEARVPGRFVEDGGDEQLVRLRRRWRRPVEGGRRRRQGHGHRGRRRRRLHASRRARRPSRRSSPASRTRPPRT